MDTMITQSISLESLRYAIVDVYAVARRNHCVSVKENSFINTHDFTFLECTLFPMALGLEMNADFYGDMRGNWWIMRRKFEG